MSLEDEVIRIYDKTRKKQYVISLKKLNALSKNIYKFLFSLGVNKDGTFIFFFGGGDRHIDEYKHRDHTDTARLYPIHVDRKWHTDCLKKYHTDEIPHEDYYDTSYGHSDGYRSHTDYCYHDIPEKRETKKRIVEVP